MGTQVLQIQDKLIEFAKGWMEIMTSSRRLTHSLETLFKELSVWVAATRDFDVTASHALKQEEEAVIDAEQ